jgi:hypothetical protein
VAIVCVWPPMILYLLLLGWCAISIMLLKRFGLVRVLFATAAVAVVAIIYRIT